MGGGVMASLGVQIIGLEKLQAGVAAGPQTLASEVRTAMTAGSILIEGTGRTLAPKFSGRLAGSITFAITGSGANLTSKIGPSVAYGIVMEDGRGAGKSPPPVAAIANWANSKGIDPFVLARSIGRKGIKARPYMRPSFDQNEAKVTSLFQKIGPVVVHRMAG